MRGAALSVPAAALLLLASGCGAAPVRVDDPGLAGPAGSACAALVDALPETVGNQERREVTPADAPGAAWGDPPIVLECGGKPSSGLEPTSVCEVVNGVGWFLPTEDLEDPERDLRYTTVGFEPPVSVRVPAAYRSDPTSVTVPLAEPILATLDLVRPCV